MNANKARKYLLFGAGSIGFGVLFFFAYTLTLAGAFKSIDPHDVSDCRTLEGFVGGTEDFEAREDGTLFVSSANFRNPAVAGKIYLVDTKRSTVADVTPELDFSFQPHGVGLWKRGDTERLFVVNHRDGSALPDVAASDASQTEHTVEIFDVAPDGSLTHASTVGGDKLVSPNDVAPVGPNAFYVTNDHGYPSGFMRTLEDWLRLPAGNIVYAEDGVLTTAWKGTRYANGIAMSPNRRVVYVAETTGLQIRRFVRDKATGALTPDGTFEVGSGVDNLNVDRAGNIWTGAHPDLLAFKAHAEDPEERSASQVFLIIPRAGDNWTKEEILLDDGSRLSGSSVAWTNGYQVIVGAVFEGKLLVCPR